MNLTLFSIVVRRTGFQPVARRVAAPVLFLLAATGLAGVTIGTGARACLGIALLTAFFTAAVVTYGALVKWRDQLRFGWTAALPIPRHAAAQTLAFVVVLALVSTSLAITGIEACIAGAAHGFGMLPRVIVSLIAALWAGAGVAALAEAFRHRRARSRGNRTSRVRDPICRWRWPDDGRLAHLVAWQRRMALLRWRTSGVQLIFGALLYVIPGTGSVREGCGIVILLLAIVWLAVVVRACKATTEHARRLLAAVALDPRRGAAAGRRYPLIALGCATAWAGLGACLLGTHQWEVFVIWLACAVAVWAPQVYTGPRFSMAGRQRHE